MTRTAELVIEQLAAAAAAPLAAFFGVLAADADTMRFFHPHPLTAEFATDLCRRVSRCRDRFYVARYRTHIVGYLLLRGWDEGYTVPSFGGAVHPAVRGLGLGQVLLAHAIRESVALAAPRLRLTVYKENQRAIHVYRKFGFTFTDKNERELVGLLDLTFAPAVPDPGVDPVRLEAALHRLRRTAAKAA